MKKYLANFGLMIAIIFGAISPSLSADDLPSLPDKQAGADKQISDHLEDEIVALQEKTKKLADGLRELGLAHDKRFQANLQMMEGKLAELKWLHDEAEKKLQRLDRKMEMCETELLSPISRSKGRNLSNRIRMIHEEIRQQERIKTDAAIGVAKAEVLYMLYVDSNVALK